MPKSFEKRPKSAPKDAVFEETSKTWRHGSPAEGRFQIWHPGNTLLFDGNFKDGRLHGELRLKVLGEDESYGTDHYAFCNGLIAQFGLPDGDDLTELRAEFAEGVITAAKFHVFMDQDNEQEKLAATFRDGQLERLRWKTSASDTVFSHGGVVITRKAMKIPKPWPERIEVGVAKGKVTSHTYFDKNGAEFVLKAPPSKVAEWGQNTQPAELEGYITSGQFALDVKTFFSGEKPDEFDADAARAKNAFARLPEPHRAAALLFDTIVTNNFPTLTQISLSGYGFDCVENDLYAANEDKYFGLSYTADGDLMLFDLETGQVLEWIHDGDPFEDNAVFPSLDAYAFAIVRIELAAQKRIPKGEVKTVFKRLGFAWSVKLI